MHWQTDKQMHTQTNRWLQGMFSDYRPLSLYTGYTNKKTTPRKKFCVSAIVEQIWAKLSALHVTDVSTHHTLQISSKQPTPFHRYSSFNCLKLWIDWLMHVLYVQGVDFAWYKSKILEVYAQVCDNLTKISIMQSRMTLWMLIFSGVKGNSLDQKCVKAVGYNHWLAGEGHCFEFPLVLCHQWHRSSLQKFTSVTSGCSVEYGIRPVRLTWARTMWCRVEVAKLKPWWVRQQQGRHKLMNRARGVVVSGCTVSHMAAGPSAQMSQSWLSTTASCIHPVLILAFHRQSSCQSTTSLTVT